MKQAVKIIIGILIGAAVIAGGIFGYKKISMGNLMAEVASVSNMNYYYWGDEISSYGYITSDSAQNVYAYSNMTISEVYVEEGQAVATGDALVCFDAEEAEINLSQKKLEISMKENELTLAKSKLSRLKNTAPIAEDATGDAAIGYTLKELTSMITEEEQEIKNLDLSIRRLKLELEQLENANDTGVITATISGTVKNVGDPENPPTDGSPFLTVSASDGLYISGTISELYLDKILPGQEITGFSWNTGTSFTGIIQSISDYPTTGSSYSNMDNSNASYYEFTALIEDATGLQNGEGAELTIAVNESGESSSIYLEKMFVRKDGAQSYVLKRGSDGKLVKQYVRTGKTVWGTAVQILEGLTEDDYIAFPYGKTAKEGVATEEVDYIY